MPAEECNNGKWKWGETGECVYDSQEEAEKDNEDYYENNDGKNIKIVMGCSCSGKSTFVDRFKKRGDIVWDFDKIHGALSGEDTHEHIDYIRKYIFSMREKFYNDLKNEMEVRVWIINSSPSKEIRTKFLEELNAEILYIKRDKKECLEIAKNERPKEWIKYIDEYFEKFEEITDDENIKIIEVKGKEMKVDKRHIISVTEDDDTYTIVYEKDRDEDDEEIDEVIDDKEGEEIDDEEIEEDKDESYFDTERNKPLQKEVKDIWTKTITMEKRYFNIDTRTEKRDDGSITITGHAAVFNQMSSDLGGFREIIAPNAFENVLNDDVRALVNHDPNLLLARTTSGTLNLKQTDKGLQYSFDVPDTTYGRDLIISMERGDVSQSSFAFTIEDDSWETTEDGEVRTINKVKQLYDVSPVTYPAYPDADDLTLAQRSLAVHKEKEENKREEKDLVKRSLLKLKIELKKRS
jgi:HK97 family phage prohead protease